MKINPKAFAIPILLLSHQPNIATVRIEIVNVLGFILIFLVTLGDHFFDLRLVCILFDL